MLQSYFEPEFCSRGFLKYDAIYEYADKLIGKFDIRSGQGARTITRSMSGGNQQKAIVAREIDRDPDVLIAVQPTRGLDVGAIEYIPVSYTHLAWRQTATAASSPTATTA